MRITLPFRFLLPVWFWAVFVVHSIDTAMGSEELVPVVFGEQLCSALLSINGSIARPAPDFYSASEVLGQAYEASPMQMGRLQAPPVDATTQGAPFFYDSSLPSPALTLSSSSPGAHTVFPLPLSFSPLAAHATLEMLSALVQNPERTERLHFHLSFVGNSELSRFKRELEKRLPPAEIPFSWATNPGVSRPPNDGNETDLNGYGAIAGLLLGTPIVASYFLSDIDSLKSMLSIFSDLRALDRALPILVGAVASEIAGYFLGPVVARSPRETISPEYGGWPFLSHVLRTSPKMAVMRLPVPEQQGVLFGIYLRGRGEKRESRLDLFFVSASVDHSESDGSDINSRSTMPVSVVGDYPGVLWSSFPLSPLGWRAQIAYSNRLRAVGTLLRSGAVKMGDLVRWLIAFRSLPPTITFRADGKLFIFDTRTGEKTVFPDPNE